MEIASHRRSVPSSGGPMGVGGASRLFRDFVEKLERAYIAFDGVVGSCLGRAWGGPPTTTWRTTTLTLFRETRNPISQNAPHFLSLSLPLFLPLSPRRLTPLFFTFRPSWIAPYPPHCASPFLFLSLHLALSERRTNSTVYPFVYELETSLSPSLFPPLSFLSLTLTFSTLGCMSFPLLESSCSRARYQFWDG